MTNKREGNNNDRRSQMRQVKSRQEQMGQVQWGQSRRDPRGHKKRPEACEGLRSTQGGGSGEGFTWWRDSGERDRRGRRYRCRRAPARTALEQRQVRRLNRRSRGLRWLR